MQTALSRGWAVMGQEMVAGAAKGQSVAQMDEGREVGGIWSVEGWWLK